MGLLSILKRLLGIGAKKVDAKPNTSKALEPRPLPPPKPKVKPKPPAVKGKKAMVKNDKRIYRK